MDTIKTGKFIAECRKEKKLTQLDLAKKMHITDKAVSKWERGVCCPDISLLPQLADELSVSISEILNGERIEYVDLTQTDALLQASVSEYTKEARKQAWLYMIKHLALFLIIVLIGISALYYTKYSRVDELKVAYVDTYSTLIEQVTEKSYILTGSNPQNVPEYNQYIYFLVSSSDALSRLQHYGREHQEIIALSSKLYEQQTILMDCVANVVITNNCITLNPKDDNIFNKALTEIETTYLELEHYMQELGYLSYSNQN